jgi:hypothetical protein
MILEAFTKNWKWRESGSAGHKILRKNQLKTRAFSRSSAESGEQAATSRGRSIEIRPLGRPGEK